MLHTTVVKLHIASETSTCYRVFLWSSVYIKHGMQAALPLRWTTATVNVRRTWTQHSQSLRSVLCLWTRSYSRLQSCTSHNSYMHDFHPKIFSKGILFSFLVTNVSMHSFTQFCRLTFADTLHVNYHLGLLLTGAVSMARGGLNANKHTTDYNKQQKRST